MTLEEVLNVSERAHYVFPQPSLWERFCDLKGFSVYAVKEGGGHVEVDLTVDEARKIGIVR